MFSNVSRTVTAAIGAIFISTVFIGATVAPSAHAAPVSAPAAATSAAR